MNRNRINGKETNLAYDFNKKLLKDLEITLVTPQQEGSNIEGTPLVEDSSPFQKLFQVVLKKLNPDGKTQETKEDKTTTVKKSKKEIVKGSIINYTSSIDGKNKSIDFSKLDESDVEQLKINAPEVYKKYETWLNTTQNPDNKIKSSYFPDSKKFKGQI